MQKRITKRTRLAQKRRKKNMLLTLAGLMLLIIAYAGLGWGLAQQKVTITNVQVVGNVVVSTEQLESTVRQGLGVVRGLLLYGGTIFTYDKKSIVADVLHAYPRLKNATLNMKDFHTLELTVAEREPVAQWCDGDKEYLGVGPLNLAVGPPSCYLVDGDGFVFDLYLSMSPGVPWRHWRMMTSKTGWLYILGICLARCFGRACCMAGLQKCIIL